MALSAPTIWEVRTASSDTNGGGFDPTVGGTDYSQQDSPQVTYTDLVIGSAGNETQLTSSAFPFTSAHVGNVINITGGAGFTTGRYQVTSVVSAVATMDRAVGTADSTAGTGKLGGALANLAVALASMVGSNAVYLKLGAYTTAANIVFPALTGHLNHLISGYQSARGDNPVGVNRPVVKATADTLKVFELNGNGFIVENVIVDGDCPTRTSIRGIHVGNNSQRLINVTVKNCDDHGFQLGGGDSLVLNCEATGCLGASRAAINVASPCEVVDSWAHDNTCDWGMRIAAPGFIRNCISESNVIGVQLDDYEGSIEGSTIYGNSSDGIRAGQEDYVGSMNLCLNNVIYGNGGYGFKNNGVALVQQVNQMIDYNAFGNNTSGARLLVPVGSHDITLTADPFKNAAGNDFRLNNAIGGGRLCRTAASPNKVAGQTGYKDLGALQHKEDAGSPAMGSIRRQ